MVIDPETGSIVVILVIFILIKGICSSFKEAIGYINKNDYRNEDSKRNSLLLKILGKEKRIITTFEFLNNILMLILGILISLKVYLFMNGHSIFLLITTSVITVIIVQILGDAIPKRIANKNSTRVVIRTVKVVNILYVILYPFTFAINEVGSIILNLFGFKEQSYIDKITKETIQHIVETGEEHGVINESEKEMIDSIFSFNNKKVERIIKARTEVFCIDINEPINEYIDEMLEKRYSRIPVYDENIDNIIGILYVKDFFIEAKRLGFDKVNIREILKEPYFIPEMNTVKEIFEELQSSKKQIAIIIDEYGGFSGIVTIEDLIEEIMGEIEDEYDARKTGIHEIDNNTYLIEGVTLLEDINDRLGIKIISEEMDTLSGYLISSIGRIPIKNESINEDEKSTFIIEEVSDRRIEKVILSINK